MKLKMEYLQILIKLIVLIIMIVTLFIIFSILYSTRYLNDLHTYINAKVTFKHISSISDLNLTVLDSNKTWLSLNDLDFTTEADVWGLYDDIQTNVSEDYIESQNKVLNWLNEMGNGENKYQVPVTKGPDTTVVDFSDLEKEDPLLPALSWSVAIFLRNSTTNQFQHICDGALVSRNTVLTAAQCVINEKNQSNPNDFLLFVGRRSLLNLATSEQAYKSSNIIIHENFTEGSKMNDLALIRLESDVKEIDSVGIANISVDDNFTAEMELTTAWNAAGSLQSVLIKAKSDCRLNAKSEEIICATYVNGLKDCPTLGSLYAAWSPEQGWQLLGLLERMKPLTSQFFCTDDRVDFTSIAYHLDWIQSKL